MPRSSKFTPVKTDKGWMLNIPARYSLTNKRARHFFPTRDLAAAAAKNLRESRANFGDQPVSISPSLADQALQAAEILKPYGLGILDAARRIAEVEKANLSSTSIENACDQFVLSRGEMSDSQRTAYRLAIKYLVEDFAGRQIGSITGDEIQAHADSRAGGPGAYNQKVRLVRTIWRWSAKPPRKWCSIEPVEHLEKRETVSKAIGVLTAKQAEKLLRTAEKRYPETVPAFALALFTGIRRKEMERLEAEDLSAEGIAIPASKSKTKRRRFIQMTEPVAAWLKAYPVGDSPIPPDWERKERTVRRLAGWRVWSPFVKDKSGDPIPPPMTLPEWPGNALRHTAASVALALGKPIETLVFEHGHSGGLTTLQRHYIGVMPKAEAQKIWALRPTYQPSTADSQNIS